MSGTIYWNIMCCEHFPLLTIHHKWDTYTENKSHLESNLEKCVQYLKFVKTLSSKKDTCYNVFSNWYHCNYREKLNYLYLIRIEIERLVYSPPQINLRLLFEGS